MMKILFALTLCLSLGACQNFYVLPSLGAGTANGPFVNVTPGGVSVAPGGSSGGDVCAAQSTKACVGCSVRCKGNQQASCREGKDAGPVSGAIADPVCAQESRCRCE